MAKVSYEKAETMTIVNVGGQIHASDGCWWQYQINLAVQGWHTLDGNYLKRMASVQWRGALWIACAHHTVSKPAILVIARLIIIDLLAKERSGNKNFKWNFERKTEVGGTAKADAASTDHMQLAGILLESRT